MRIRNYNVILFLLALSVSNVFAQGSVKGIVTDSLMGNTLFGANVFLTGTSLGAASDIEGEYRISPVPAGEYTVKFSYIGYQQKEIDVVIQDGRTLELNMSLSPMVIEGELVVVTAQAQGQVAAINQQLSSNTIVNVVSEEKIKELPDANAAEAIGRLPGVSVTRSGGEANKIILRGLSDRYTNVTIDGIQLSGTDSTARGIDLSTISQGSLAGIELYKALTPDKDADAIAGSVNLVTKKAPGKREIRVVTKGGYNDLMNSFKQYDFNVKYGERFFNNALGVQLAGNIDDKFRSNERIDLGYTTYGDRAQYYFINDFEVQFTNEKRTRKGFSTIFDLDTPDDGVVKFSTNYNATKRDYLISQRNYPNGADGGSSQVSGVGYSYRDRQQEITTFSSAITGDNNFFDYNLTYGLSYAQSKADYPYDYEMIFSEPSILGVSGMRNVEPVKENPEKYITAAYNNFLAATLSGANYRTQNNFEKNRTAYLNISREYNLWGLSGELKLGAKYKTKYRNNSNTLKYAPYYLGFWQPYERTSDGSIRMKDLTGTSFDDFWQRYLLNPQNRTLSFSELLNDSPESRDIFDKYALNPLIDRDKMHEWYDLNKNGIGQAGLDANLEYFNDKSVQANNYSITESVFSTYLMNTLNIGQSITLIAGLRIEQENNNYKNKYSKQRFAGFPVPNATTRDTSSSYTETIILPNFHLNIQATDFMNIRIAAYKALSRPDFNMRLNTYFAWRPAAVSSTKQLFAGNPGLKTAKAWNFEINTSFYGNEIGLISVSAFYKEIADMYHMLNQLNTAGDTVFKSLDLDFSSLHQGSYALTIPYNSPEKSMVWGFEFEHQINFAFLPGLLKNIVLSYNTSIIRSETTLFRTVVDTVYKTIPGFPIPLPSYEERVVQITQQLENQPELFGNISLGYDIADFSARISLFHQSQYNVSFSSSRRGDRVSEAYTRLDLALKYKITDYLSTMLTVNNLNNIKESKLIYNREIGYKILDTSELYGLTADLSIKLNL